MEQDLIALSIVNQLDPLERLSCLCIALHGIRLCEILKLNLANKTFTIAQPVSAYAGSLILINLSIKI